MTSEKIWRYPHFYASIIVAILGSTPAGANSVLFSEDFSSLVGWTGKANGSHQGILVSDPFDASNQVLTFSGLNVSGDIFTSAPLAVQSDGQTIISFDYLGLPSSGSNPGNLGGFFGISLDLLPEGGDGAWIAGTEQSAVNGLGFTGIELLDDGQWHRYEIDITSIITQNNLTHIYLLLEDWKDAGGIAGDAFFDNIEVRNVNVPETPLTIFLLAGSVAALFMLSSRGVSQNQALASARTRI